MGAKAQLASSAANGGSFESGFVSGALSSAISSAAGAAFGGPSTALGKSLRDVGMVGVGGLTGGLGSVIGGGSFWSGVRQGIITSGLNHVMHAGLEGIMSGGGGNEPSKAYQDGADKVLGAPQKLADMNMAVGALSVANTLQVEALAFTARSSFKSATTYKQWGQLRATQQQWRLSRALGSTGRIYYQGATKLGYGLGWAGIFYTAGNTAVYTFNAVKTGSSVNYLVYIKMGLDIGFTYVGMYGGPYGAGASILYWGLDSVTNGFGGWGTIPNK